MEKERKTDQLQIRITPTEKKEIMETAQKKGYAKYGGFILYLWRKFGKKDE